MDSSCSPVVPDQEQDFDEAVRTYEVLAVTYEGYGYQLRELPRCSIAERVRFVLENVPS